MIAITPHCGAVNALPSFDPDVGDTDHDKFVRTPSVYHMGKALRDETWERMVFTIANCGYYIPHVLSPAVRYNKDFPLIHLLYKALPQRCQCKCSPATCPAWAAVDARVVFAQSATSPTSRSSTWTPIRSARRFSPTCCCGA